jgi:hypothetical protein
MNNSWNKAYIDEQGRICYQSGGTLYCEQLVGGRLCACGYNTGATGRPEGLNYHPNSFLKNRCFALTVNGTELVYDYQWANGAADDSFAVTHEEDGSMHVTLCLVAPKFGIGVQVHTRLYGGDVMLRYLTLENLTDAPMTIGQTKFAVNENAWKSGRTTKNESLSVILAPKHWSEPTMS